MLAAPLNRIILAAILIAVIPATMVGMLVVRAADDPTEAGTVISNRAEATYEDETGASYGTVSPTISITVLSVSTLLVTPDETESSEALGPHERVTRIFRICNAGNTPDFYTITRAEVNAPASIASLHFDTDASGTLTDADALIQVGQSMSPRARQGSCVGVLAVIDTNDSAPQSALAIRLTARSNVVSAVNGTGEDSGTIINVIGKGSVVGSPDNPGLPPEKTVNGSSRAVVAPGNPFTYTIAFRNHGDVAAHAVVVADELPAGIEYAAGSLRLDERNLTDAEDADEGKVAQGRVQVLLSQVDPGQLVRISFRATMTSGATGGVGLVNSAVISGQNLRPVASSNAVVLVDPFGTVFSARSNGATAIAGARVEMLLDQNGENPLATVLEQGFLPNTRNENPYMTDGQGHYSFALTPEQLGTEGTPKHYFLRVTAPGYITRMMELTAHPTRADLFGMTVHALDDQPLARAGHFDLVTEDVQIEDLAAVALNIPMFERRNLEISKSADRQRAEIGDAITYRVEVHNSTSAPVRELVVRDRLPDSFHYAAGTARLGETAASAQPIEPQIEGEELVFRIPELGAGATARILYRTRVGANAREGAQENLAVAQAVFPTGERIQTAAARAVVHIGGGVFSTRQVILGRVFEDVNGTGLFEDVDRPLAGVRLFLQSGQSVVTDSQGLYSFPSLGDGPQVIALDPVSVPAGYVLSDNGTVAGHSWTRLLRTPVGGGALLRQNFALVSNDSQSHAPQATSTTGAMPPTDSLPSLSATQGASGAGDASRMQETARLRETAPSTSERPRTAGTYEVASTETLEPVAPGEVRVLSPSANAIVMSPAMQIEARVMLNWTIHLEVNGEHVSDKNIGQSRLDQKNNVSTFTFVGLSLRPGPNRIAITAVSPEGAPGRTESFLVLGRGPARRLEITSEKTEIQADGRDSTIVHVSAFDQWGSPALDGQVALSVSAGRLQLMADAATGEAKSSQEKLDARNGGVSPEQAREGESELLVMLQSGEAALRLVSSGAPGQARLQALMGGLEAQAEVRITPESRPAILVGLAEVTIGKAIPEVNLRGEEGNLRSRLSFFYHGNLWNRSILTLAYDSQRPINRTAGRDRLFQLDPLDRVYPLFGDSSTRYQAAQSNSKLYARIDMGRSYVMFGDFTADMDELALAGYTRKLTGIKAHLENSRGDYVTVTGARPDTAFARDVFPGGTLGILRLSHSEILPGSETLMLEVRDRRNPEIILSSEQLVRSVDYNLNPATGEIFFLRYISTFDYALNLVQVVVTYEHRSDDLSTAIYTGRAVRNFQGLGLRMGLSAIVQESDLGSFILGGLDGTKSLPHGGELRFAYARSQGEIMSSGNIFDEGSREHNGDAYRLELVQPLSFYEAVLRARYANASAGFFNPYGATVTPGARRGEVSFEFKPRSRSTLRFGVMSERNRTDAVDNSRLTLSAMWEQVVNERLRFHLGFDHRSFSDELTDRHTESNLITAAAEVQVTDKLSISAKREQNIGEADPTYPNQTTLAATYQVNQLTRIFFTQRLASAPIVPIGDVAQTGFAFTEARRETAVGVETRFGKYTSLIGRYQLENGASGTDSFAVIGLQNRLPLTSELSLELGFERGFHLAGDGESFNSATLGFGWTPTQDFRASARYEFRDRGSVGQLFALGAAGRLGHGITVMSRVQWTEADFAGRNSSSIDGMAALALRPLESDRVGLLFSYNHRALVQDGADGLEPTRDRIDTLATDGYIQATSRLELYGRFALRFNANGQPELPYVSTLTYLTQARAQYRLSSRFDWAGEVRYLMQTSTGTRRSIYGTELGLWALPDLRLGVGYNFTQAGEPAGSRLIPARRGFYFTISSKLSNLFDLFGASRGSLQATGAPAATAQPEEEKKKEEEKH
ncbi:MAG TPA: hypothetical protein VGX92_05495 [Pyrinomonadaceae bacterium]|jgi:uncharacterized repeat protein (TIGR01451 family)|nr:hypothetical protein [Pyrinomonadaceae bacterium]